MHSRYEVEFAPGLAPVVLQELNEFIADKGTTHRQHREGEISFSYDGDFWDLLRLRSVIAVYRLIRFPVPRPKALLGHQHFTMLVNQIIDVMNLDCDRYQTLYLGAAGSDSSIMVRIKDELAAAVGLVAGTDSGDLLIRLRPTPKEKNSWDVLIRLTPRPLASREWRVCNMEGAVNASVAHAMIRLTQPGSEDTFLNIACGSGTIMIERGSYQPSRHIIGCDIDTSALKCAEENISNHGLDGNLRLLHSDGCALPLSANSVDVLCADLPFGQLVGSHEENVRLYPRLLAEAGRVARLGARFILITHEVRLMQSVLAAGSVWRLKAEMKITLSGLHPRIYSLERQ